MALILSQSQAEAVYSAASALNKIFAASTKIELRTIPGRKLTVELRPGRIVVQHFAADAVHNEREDYDTRKGFATAYGLNADDPAPSSYAGTFGTSGNMPGPQF